MEMQPLCSLVHANTAMRTQTVCNLLPTDEKSAGSERCVDKIGERYV